MSQKEKEFVGLVNDFRSAMLTTMNEQGDLQSRPMQLAEVTDDCQLWFITDRDSGKVDQMVAYPQVGVTMQGGGKFVSLSGRAQASEDHQRLKRVWNKAWDLWFPAGVDDPNIFMFTVIPKYGEYWDMSGTQRLRFLYEAGKAYFQGVEIDPEKIGGNSRVSFQ